MKGYVKFWAVVLLSVLVWPARSGHAAEPGWEADILAAADAKALLAKVELANELLYSDLQNFVCDERIDRYRGPVNKNDERRIDTITSTVSFENGVERYTEIRQNDRSRSRMSDLTGAWSEGEFGTLLRQTQTLLDSQAVVFLMNTVVNQTPALLYRFVVSEEDSPWDFEVESRHYDLPFRTDVWVSRADGQILKIERTSTVVPLQTRISEVRWSVSLDTVDLHGKSWLLPKAGEYSVSYGKPNVRERNLMTFSDCRRYGSRVVLSFDTD